MSEAAPEQEILNSRLLEYPRERVFAAFSNADDLAQWWGPAGFTNTFEVHDFRPDGEWTFTMHSPDGHDFKNVCVFREIVKPSSIVIEHLPAPHFVLEITLDVAEGGTLLTWRQRFDTAEMWDKVVKYAGNANEENLDRLEGVLGNGRSMNS